MSGRAPSAGGAGGREILTNNPLLSGVLWGVPVRRVEGGPLEVLMEARRRVEAGAELVSAPLPPNGRLMRSPWRSLLLRGPGLSEAIPGEGGEEEREKPLRWSAAGPGGEILDRAIERIGLLAILPDPSGGFARLDGELLRRALREEGLPGEGSGLP
jgi:hypothetical protein